MKKIILVLMGVLFLAVSGCQEGSFSRYPAVEIPQFSDEEYYSLLSDKNPQVVYNAVVNLGSQAAELGKILSEEKADKNSPKYIMAEKIYKKMVELLSSRNAYTVAASLRFLQVFSNKSTIKAELLGPALKIKNNNPQVIYEQIAMLNTISNKNTGISDSTLRQFLNNPSWVVSHSTYLLIDSLENDRLRQELIARYRAVNDEKEKLLILTALRKQPNDAAADLFFSEILSTKSSKIRYAIYDILGNCKNQEKVLAWVAQNYEKILAADGKYLFQRHADTMGDNFSAKLLAIFLNNGFVADQYFLKRLDEKLEEYANEEDAGPKGKEKINNLKTVEKALFTGKAMAADWKIMLDKKEALNAKLATLQTDYDVLIKEFSAKVDEFFKKHGISEEKRKEYLAGVTHSREILKELLIADEEDASQKE